MDMDILIDSDNRALRPVTEAVPEAESYATAGSFSFPMAHIQYPYYGGDGSALFVLEANANQFSLFSKGLIKGTFFSSTNVYYKGTDGKNHAFFYNSGDKKIYVHYSNLEYKRTVPVTSGYTYHRVTGDTSGNIYALDEYQNGSMRVAKFKATDYTLAGTSNLNFSYSNEFVGVDTNGNVFIYTAGDKYIIKLNSAMGNVTSYNAINVTSPIRLNQNNDIVFVSGGKFFKLNNNLAKIKESVAIAGTIGNFFIDTDGSIYANESNAGIYNIIKLDNDLNIIARTGINLTLLQPVFFKDKIIAKTTIDGVSNLLQLDKSLNIVSSIPIIGLADAMTAYGELYYYSTSKKTIGSGKQVYKIKHYIKAGG